MSGFSISRSALTRGAISVKNFGAVGNGVANDTAAMQTAIDAVAAAGGGTLHVPRGTYKVTGITLADNVTLHGDGKLVSIIKLANGANQHVIQAGGFDLYANGVARDVPVGCKTAGLRALCIDGNKANQAAAKHGLAYYGVDVQIEEVEFKNAKGVNLYLESPGATYSGVVGQNLQASIRHVECHDGAVGNFAFNGQSDSNIIDVMCYQAGNGAGQYNAWFGSKAAGTRVFGMHCWGDSDYAIISEAGLIDFQACHAESAAVAKVWAKQPIIWNGGRIYEASANTGAVGFKLDKDYNQIRGVTATNINGGLIDTSAGGIAGQHSIIEVMGYTASAGATLYAGAISSTSDVALRLFGVTTANLRQTSQLNVFKSGLTANGVITAGAGGIDMNSNGIDRCNYFAGQGWALVTSAAGVVTVSTSFVSLNEAAPVNITDILSSLGLAGILQVTFRNGSASAVTFVHSVAKLRNIGAVNKVLNQHESITYVFVAGTVWQQTGGK